MKKVLVYGSKEFGQVVKNLVKECGHEFIGFIDDFYKEQEVLGDFEAIKLNYKPDDYMVAIAVGYKNLNLRWEIYQKVIEAGYKVTTLIHPTAYIQNINNIGQGTFIMAGSIVDLNSSISELCVLWPGVIINHDSIIGYNTFLSPGSIICGSSTVGEMCFIGAGAVIVDHISVPANSFIKAGERYSIRDNICEQVHGSLS